MAFDAGAAALGPDGDDRPGASSVLVIEKVRRILDCFTSHGPVLRTADICKATAMPSSTCARLLNALVREGILEREGGGFRIGLRMLSWTSSAARASELVTAARPVLQALRDGTRETSCLFVQRGAARICVAVAESDQTVIHRVSVGEIRPLHAGATGKVFLAYDGVARREVFRGDLPSLTPNTVTDPSVLEEQLKVIRALGYAVAHEERERGLSSLSAPVFGADGTLVAVLAVGAPAFRLTDDDVPRITPLVLRATTTLSHHLGYSGPAPGPGADAVGVKSASGPGG